MERRRKHTSHRPSKNSSYSITVYNRQRDLSIERSSVKKLVSFVLSQKKVQPTGVEVYFVSKEKITELHEQYFDDPTPTDCITFPMHELAFLGEIFICPKIAMEYDPKKPYLETTLYIIHSLLHLLGYDDLQRKKRERMQREEKRLLKLCQNKRCILQTSH
jgi:probable rRNA maturation factor